MEFSKKIIEEKIRNDFKIWHKNIVSREKADSVPLYSSWHPYACSKHRAAMQKWRTIRGYLENHRAIQEPLWNNLWVMQELCMNLVRTICGSCKNHVTNHKGFFGIT